MNRSSLGLVSSLALVAACGGAPGPAYSPPVASLHGIITQASVSTPEQLHVAFVWSNFDSDEQELKSAQEIGVRAELPVRFQLDVSQLPPETAMNRLSAEDAEDLGIDRNSFRFAFGSVLVYDDTNGSGGLDLLQVDATSYVDRPLGAAKPWVMYIEGTPPPPAFADGSQLVAGFNLMDMSDCPAEQDFCRPHLNVLPISTELEIALSADPKLAAMVCQFGGAGGSGAVGGGGSGGGMPNDGPPDVGGGSGSGYTPPPAGATVECAADGRSYTSTLCEMPGLCSGTDCLSLNEVLPPGEPAPAGWPCTL